MLSEAILTLNWACLTSCCNLARIIGFCPQILWKIFVPSPPKKTKFLPMGLRTEARIPTWLYFLIPPSDCLILHVQRWRLQTTSIDYMLLKFEIEIRLCFSIFLFRAETRTGTASHHPLPKRPNVIAFTWHVPVTQNGQHQRQDRQRDIQGNRPVFSKTSWSARDCRPSRQWYR